MIPSWIDVLVPAVAALGQPEGPPSLYRALYATFPVALGLAILNGAFAVLIGVLLYLKLDERPWARFAELWTVVTVWLQVLLGIAPFVLIARALHQGQELSLPVYGMPVCQILVAIFCLYFQVRLVRAYRTRRHLAGSHSRLGQ